MIQLDISTHILKPRCLPTWGAALVPFQSFKGHLQRTQSILSSARLHLEEKTDIYIMRGILVLAGQ